MSIMSPYDDDLVFGFKRGKVEIRPSLSFSDENKVGPFCLMMTHWWLPSG